MGMDQDRLISMKSGGSNLDELTKFCKELAKKGLADRDRIDMLAESESDSEEEFHHPFMVKDKPLPNPITMLIGEPKETLNPAARAVAKSQRMLEFPVSSGNAHRTKEGDLIEGPGTAAGEPGDWQPVETSSALSELARPALTTDLKADEEEMLKFHEQMEQEEKDLREAASGSLWTLSEEDKDILKPKGKKFFEPAEPEIQLDDKQLAEIEKLKPKPSELAAVLSKATLPLALPAPALPTMGDTRGDVSEPISKDPNKVFDKVAAPVMDIGTIVSRRLNAMRKLQKDPNDAEALAEMYDAQQMMSDWAGSKNKPGQVRRQHLFLSLFAFIHSWLFLVRGQHRRQDLVQGRAEPRAAVLGQAGAVQQRPEGEGRLRRVHAEEDGLDGRRGARQVQVRGREPAPARHQVRQEGSDGGGGDQAGPRGGHHDGLQGSLR